MPVVDNSKRSEKGCDDDEDSDPADDVEMADI
jgi:hypothetical protein